MQEAHSILDDADLGQIHGGLERVYEVSKHLDFPFTLDEVTAYFLPNQNLTSRELESLIVQRRFPDMPFRIKNGYLMTPSTQSELPRLELEKISAAKLRSAVSFANVLKKLVPFIQSIAVTGTVAYASADKWDDIDLFMVTDRRRLWTSAFLSLVLIRISKLLRLRSLDLLLFCLSYVHDTEGFASQAAKNQGNPLFARELLKAKPVVGIKRYRKLLEENVWVSKIYGKSYNSRLLELELRGDGESCGEEQKSSLLLDWVEGIAFIFLSRYLRLRAYLNNLKLKSQGQTLRVFDPILSRSSCVYTSNFYRWLRSLWND